MDEGILERNRNLNRGFGSFWYGERLLTFMYLLSIH